MCLAVPAQIMLIETTNAKVDIMGVESCVNIQLIEKPEVGDYILVHAGCGIQKIDSDYFEELQQILGKLLEDEQKDGSSEFN